MHALSKMATMVAVFLLLNSCGNSVSSNKEMISLLSTVAQSAYSPYNNFCPEAKLHFYDSMLATAPSLREAVYVEYLKANAMLELGKEDTAMEISKNVLNKLSNHGQGPQVAVMKQLAITSMRIGERRNCVKDHSGESCVFPIAGKGVHGDKWGSEKAIEQFERLLQYDPNDLESRWLLNIAYMTTGGYPDNVPAAWLIKGLDTGASAGVKPFVDVAVQMGLNTNNMAGGNIVDDFNNDGYLDIVTSSWSLDQGMHYCRNNSNGSFTDISEVSGLKAFTGGLNIMQTDYNNDGLKDIFVLRGAWKGKFGKEPNSLLKNNGDGTFTDVTKASGLLSFHPTQTATWADFNNDGWLDVFIGNETSDKKDPNPCELYMNNGNGTFTEVAEKAGCKMIDFVKGVTSGDYNNDGLTDIFISCLSGRKALLKNEGVKDKTVSFTDVTAQAGLAGNTTRTFPTWFWDYDNDGWLDLLVSGYEFDRSLAWYAAGEALGMPVGNSGKLLLYRNKHDGTFEDVSEKAGVQKVVFAMGCNFGDIDNDGYLDMYFGTGNPDYQSLVPNKLFKNIQGRGFVDVTTAARVGNLQKGHGVAFADLDNDGDQDIYIDMGGAFAGDAYQNSLYVNPGQNDNRWINISLEGVQCNRAAIGAKIKVTFSEQGVVRSVYRDVNSGGSFGANPLMQHIGIGTATSIQSIEIKWPGSQTVQVFRDIAANGNIRIRQGSNTLVKTTLTKVDFTLGGANAVGCAPTSSF
ncbi:CRTAC1 family protein [Pseudoflavitalea sp. X16]|uniref:CRTAC1 family protein n=1 Tax=Paraflavitalea devenefica TaxID=2716334 RepID=UPI001421AE75|nr:CRTAC1 family protein [Paraflavitalea devenefica]NII28866.1 CRTAC1 family protein [Paraflavitalea devenefica]